MTATACEVQRQLGDIFKKQPKQSVCNQNILLVKLQHLVLASINKNTSKVKRKQKKLVKAPFARLHHIALFQITKILQLHVVVQYVVMEIVWVY